MWESISKKEKTWWGSQREWDTAPYLSACLWNITLEQILPGINMKDLQVIDAGQKNVIFYGDPNRDQPLGFCSADAVVAWYIFLSLNKEALDVFKWEIVVDLWAGDNTYGYQIANRAWAKIYIWVEPCNYEYLEHDISVLRAEDPEKYRVPAIVVREDMGRFLQRLPDNSVSIFCSGIDRFVLEEQYYRMAVWKEILRTLKKCYIWQNPRWHIEISYLPGYENIKAEVFWDVWFTVYSKK